MNSSVTTRWFAISVRAMYSANKLEKALALAVIKTTPVVSYEYKVILYMQPSVMMTAMNPNLLMNIKNAFFLNGHLPV